MATACSITLCSPAEVSRRGGGSFGPVARQPSLPALTGSLQDSREMASASLTRRCVPMIAGACLRTPLRFARLVGVSTSSRHGSPGPAVVPPVIGLLTTNLCSHAALQKKWRHGQSTRQRTPVLPVSYSGWHSTRVARAVPPNGRWLVFETLCTRLRVPAWVSSQWKARQIGRGPESPSPKMGRQAAMVSRWQDVVFSGRRQLVYPSVGSALRSRPRCSGWRAGSAHTFRRAELQNLSFDDDYRDGRWRRQGVPDDGIDVGQHWSWTTLTAERPS